MWVLYLLMAAGCVVALILAIRTIASGYWWALALVLADLAIGYFWIWRPLRRLPNEHRKRRLTEQRLHESADRLAAALEERASRS